MQTYSSFRGAVTPGGEREGVEIITFTLLPSRESALATGCKDSVQKPIRTQHEGGLVPGIEQWLHYRRLQC